MSINETISGAATSTTTTPTSVTSDIVVERPAAGRVFLEQQVSGGNWVVAEEVKQAAQVVLTPDTSITYRFRAEGVGQAVRVFFGP